MTKEKTVNNWCCTHPVSPITFSLLHYLHGTPVDSQKFLITLNPLRLCFMYFFFFLVNYILTGFCRDNAARVLDYAWNMKARKNDQKCNFRKHRVKIGLNKMRDKLHIVLSFVYLGKNCSRCYIIYFLCI